MKDIASIATVVTWLSAVLRARMAPPRSICETSQPPKMSPLALATAGIAMVRMTTSPRGEAGSDDAGADMAAPENKDRPPGASRERAFPASFPLFSREGAGMVRNLMNAGQSVSFRRLFDEGGQVDCVGIEERVAKYRSEEHTSELQSRQYLVCRLLLEKKKA